MALSPGPVQAAACCGVAGCATGAARLSCCHRGAHVHSVCLRIKACETFQATSAPTLGRCNQRLAPDDRPASRRGFICCAGVCGPCGGHRPGRCGARHSCDSSTPAGKRSCTAGATGCTAGARSHCSPSRGMPPLLAAMHVLALIIASPAAASLWQQLCAASAALSRLHLQARWT